MKQVLVCALIAASLTAPLQAADGEKIWARSVVVVGSWAYIACDRFWVGPVCKVRKANSDPQVLPAVISVGDPLEFRDSSGSLVFFHVVHIQYTVEPGRRADPGGDVLAIRHRRTSCTLYNAISQADTDDSADPSRITISDCNVVR